MGCTCMAHGNVHKMNLEHAHGLAQHDSPTVEALQRYEQPRFLEGLAYGQRACEKSIKGPSCRPESKNELDPVIQ